MKRAYLILVMLVLAAATAYAENCPPSKVSDLAAVVIGKTTVPLGFTDAGDDCLSGTATSFEIRRSASAITEANYYSATVVVSNGTPAGSGGTADCYSVTGLTQGTTYYFAITFTDASGNRSPVSNSPSVTTNTSGTEKYCP